MRPTDYAPPITTGRDRVAIVPDQDLASDPLSESVLRARSIEARDIEEHLRSANAKAALSLKAVLLAKRAAAGVRLRARIIGHKVSRRGHRLLDDLTCCDVYGIEGMALFFSTVALWVSPLYMIIKISLNQAVLNANNCPDLFLSNPTYVAAFYSWLDAMSTTGEAQRGSAAAHASGLPVEGNTIVEQYNDTFNNCTHQANMQVF